MYDFNQRRQHSHPEWTPPAEWTAPEGWTCSSYGNDTCPSYTHPNGMIVFVEYPEGQRECEGVHQYTVFAEYGECDPALLETDSYSEFVTFIKEL